MKITCGEATIRLLREYGIHVVFGIPGVHTLDLCRALSNDADGECVRHIQARNEQGAGFMAEGWARATGKPGVALVISGPGVTNTTTALAQCYAQSLPMLLLSAEPHSASLGKGTGVLHEITDQSKVTQPITAFSATARSASDIPELIARAFTVFEAKRPRPVHISIPIDVQAQTVEAIWHPVNLPKRPGPDPQLIEAAVEMLKSAINPFILIGGGAANCGADLLATAESLGAIVSCSTAGKGIVSDEHPLSLGASLSRLEVQKTLAQADVILAVATELSEADSFVPKLEIKGKMIRIDIDPDKANDLNHSELAILGDVEQSMRLIRQALAGYHTDQTGAKAKVQDLRTQIKNSLSAIEKKHVNLLKLMKENAPLNIVWSGDACQLVYTGIFAQPSCQPRSWFYPSGYCALGNALPNAIGAKLARPEIPVAVLVGDGGFMFTMPEILVAAELGLSMPIIIWENGGYKQIRDDMDARKIKRVGVTGMNPDFVRLAHSCHCHGVLATSSDHFTTSFKNAFKTDRPTIIVVRETDQWVDSNV